MKNIFFATFFTLTSSLSYSQSDKATQLTMISNYGSENSEIRDILEIEEIEYIKLRFQGKDLADKSCHLSVKKFGMER